MSNQIQKDDTESTSASTVSTLTGNKQQQQQPQQQQQQQQQPQYHFQRLSSPISTVRRISWDNCSQSNSNTNSNSISNKSSSYKGNSTNNSNGNGNGNGGNYRRGNTSSRVRRRASSSNTLKSLTNSLGGKSSCYSFGNSNSSVGGGNPQESLNGRHNEEDKKSSKAVIIGRELFIVFILVTAGVFGSMSYYVLRISEETLAAGQYISVTNGALNNVQNLAENKLVHGSRIMAKHVGWAYPNATRDWPYVWLPSYWDLMEEVLPTSIWSGLNLAPIVLPGQASRFEDFAYSKIAETFGENSTTMDTAVSSESFGRGIWVKDDQRVHTVDHRYHDTTGLPLYQGSPYTYMAPKLQDGLAFSPEHQQHTNAMMNVHGFETEGLALDAVVNCSMARKEEYTKYVAIHGEPEQSLLHYNNNNNDHHNNDNRTDDVPPNPKHSRCSALSGMLPPKNIHNNVDENNNNSDDDDNEQLPLGIAGFIATPIYPANDPYELVGFIFGIVYWVEVMIDIFPNDATGIDCVFGGTSDNTNNDSNNDHHHQYTYTLDGSGTSKLLCEDDCHDIKYDELMMTTTIIDPDLLSDWSVTYEMTCYPNDDFFKTYQTSNPSTAAIGAVGIIVFTSVLFFLYDYFVRREFRSKKDLFEAKRKFVRFVSHEVRTPMNSVCMGLNVLQEEAAMTLGYETSSAAMKHRKKMNGIASKQQHQQHTEAPSSTKTFDLVQIEHWFDLANEISANAQASVDVLDDFLNYDKIATGEMVLEYTIIPVWKLIQDTLKEFKLPMTRKHITLHNSLPTNTTKSSDFKSSMFFSDDTIQKSNSSGSSKGKITDGAISDMESGCKSDMLESAHKQKLVGDSVRITQVIRNLVSNAIKFSREGGDIHISTKFVKTVGGRRRHIRGLKAAAAAKNKKTFEMKSKEVITCEKTGEIVFSVKDSGAGLSRTQLKNLFGAGVQFDVNELQSGKGSGLGLYIAKGIVEQHGGSLVADSEGKGLGCTFTMRLPIYNPPSDVFDSSQLFWKRRRPRSRSSFEKAVRQKTVAEEYDDNDNGSDEEGEMDCTLKSLDSRDDGMSELKILLVDDSKSNRKLLDRLMTMRGHRCEQADDGHTGLEMAMRAESFGQPYDLIFMDYEMPTMNGPEAVKLIRSQGSNVYIIGLTGNIMADDVSYFHSCGANAVFAKPFKVREFEQLLEDNLARDGGGRICEKASTAFELSTHLSTLGLLEQGELHLSCTLDPGDLDDTGLSSSPESSVTDRKEWDYEAAKRALRDVSS